MVFAATAGDDQRQNTTRPMTPEIPVSQTSENEDAGPSFYKPASTLWTDTIPKTDHNLLFLNCDYASTTLGPLRDWSTPLRLYASMILSDSRPACVYWGPDRVAFYNDKFAIIAGGAHPGLMGKAFIDAFPTLQEQIEPIFQQVAASGLTVEVDNISLFPIRSGFLEEMYFIGQFIPLRGSSGEVEGFYNTCFDTTALVLSQRRRRVVEQIAAMAPYPLERTLTAFVDAFRENPRDITMAILYTFDEVADANGNNLRLIGTIGVQPGHCCAPTAAKLETDQEGLIPFFRKVKLSGKLLVLSETDGSLQATGNVFDDIAWCGFDEPARDIVISSLTAAGSTLGFLVQGTNPRRAYDESTESSIVDMMRQMEAKWVASLSIEQAKQREEQLERRAIDSENRLRHMAKVAPLGMCQVAPDETIVWANDQYYDITGHDRSNPHLKAFRAQLPLDEKIATEEAFQSVLHGATRLEREIRLERKWTPPVVDVGDTEEYHAWILAVSFPMMEDGKLKLIMGYVSDISHQKWAESVQARNASTAILAKRRQEEFIDTTSHEMRNPLSAITQLADGIARSLHGGQADTIEALRNIAEENVDAANTILACAAHQKRVIDDVLILSRLESHMLSITPVAERASSIINNTVKMFGAEAALNRAEIEVAMDHSFCDLHLDYVLVDGSRLTQILINLISNSVKFVSTQGERKISVVYGAHVKNPPELKTIYGDISWSEASDPPSVVLPPLRPDEDLLYLYFCVQDTGTGMSDEEIERLFKRFSQATSRTHVTYGGSGLGLYICKQLAERQGGRIGVASSKGEGSVFAFYVMSRAVKSPTRYIERQSSNSLSSTMSMSRQPHLPRRLSSETKPARKSCTLAEPRIESDDSLATTDPVQRPKCSVLLVEDNLINQRVLARQLRNANYLVTIANHGREALKALEDSGCWHQADPDFVDSGSKHQHHIDVVLMDWEMPVMNGLECCKEIRRREKVDSSSSKHLPVIAITANVRDEQRELAMDAGMDEVLSKPFTVADLILRIDNVLLVSSNSKG